MQNVWAALQFYALDQLCNVRIDGKQTPLFERNNSWGPVVSVIHVFKFKKKFFFVDPVSYLLKPKPL